MKLDEYFQQKRMVKCRRGMGQQSEWLEFCELTVVSEALFIVDPEYFPEYREACVIEMPPAQYELQAKVITYWNDSRISRLSVKRKESVAQLGNQLREVNVDTGRVLLSDLRAGELWKNENQEFQNMMGDPRYASRPSGVIRVGGLDMPFVAPGFGDGCYPVFSLEEGSQRVGVEIVFLEPDTPYLI